MDCKLKEGDPLSPHVIKMIGYVQALDRLGFPLLDELATDAVLVSLPPSYGTFISNYHMHGMDKKLTELHGMLKVAEQDIKKGTHQVLMVQKSAKFKKSWSKKKAKAKGTETVTSAPALKSGPNSTFAITARRPVTGRGTVASGLQSMARRPGMLLQAKVHLLHML